MQAKRLGSPLVLLFTAAAACVAQPRQPFQELSLESNGERHWFRVFAPPNLRPRSPAVMLLHGGTQSMRKIFERNAGGTQAWPGIAEREGFLLIAPNGTDPDTGDHRGDRQNWNDLRPQGPGGNPSTDHVRFLRNLAAWAQRTHGVDPARIYVTGASNGGMMTYRLLLEAPDVFAAGAAFIAAIPEGVDPPATARPLPLMIANGTEDPLVKWTGGTIPRRPGVMLSAPATAEWWTRVNRTVRVARTETLPDRDPRDGCRIHESRYAPRAGGAPLLFYRVEGGGHAMPSIAHPLREGIAMRRLIGRACRDAEGAELAWEFLRRFRL